LRGNLTDEERRKQAENAMILMSKFLKMGDDDECEDSEEDK